MVPHFDNAEGGNHDTRFCYMGERRLRSLEDQLPAGVSILGVDSHTALILDLDQRTAKVAGLGGVTVRVGGRATVFPSGSEVAIDTLAEVAAGLATGGHADIGWEPDPRSPGERAGEGKRGGREPRAVEPLRDEVALLEGSFIAALSHDRPKDAVGALLDLDDAIEARIRAGEDSPDLDNAAATFRSLIVRLGEAAVGGTADPRTTVEPFVDVLVTLRSQARDTQDWATADLIRTSLADAGVEVRDGSDGSSWTLGRTLPD